MENLQSNTTLSSHVPRIHNELQFFVNKFLVTYISIGEFEHEIERFWNPSEDLNLGYLGK